MTIRIVLNRRCVSVQNHRIHASLHRKFITPTAPFILWFYTHLRISFWNLYASPPPPPPRSTPLTHILLHSPLSWPPPLTPQMQIQWMFTCSCSLPRKSDSLTRKFLPFIIYSARVFTKVSITYPVPSRLRFSFKFLFGVFCKRDRLARLQYNRLNLVWLSWRGKDTYILKC